MNEITKSFDLLCCSSAPILVSANNRELSFEVAVRNKKENAYNTQVVATYSSNLYYSSVIPPVSQHNKSNLCFHGADVKRNARSLSGPFCTHRK